MRRPPPNCWRQTKSRLRMIEGAWDMWLDGASQAVVERFWRQGSGDEYYPRDIERAVPLALPVALVKVPSLELSGVEDWLAWRGGTFRFNCRSRSVRGCLLAYGGRGFIFVDAADPEDERRFTIAHEAAHFLSDYLLLRERACAKFGPRIAEVFDGRRTPTVGERVGALLTGATLGVYTKLMERDEAGAAGGAVYRIEDRADRVALGLLAPPEEVLAEIDTSLPTFAARHESVSRLLRRRFGLPAPAADAYARSLLESVGRGASWVESLRLR
jgi:hypothetical protein